MTMSVQTSSADDAATRRLVDYATGQGKLHWHVVNDDVMGGRSEGGFEIANGVLRFEGTTNTRGGGFSSIRTEPLQLDLSRYQGVRLKVLGDGRRYRWRITTDARWRDRPVAFWADFETVPDAWSSIDIPFTQFTPQFRGMTLQGPVLDPARITGMGLMIYDKRDGPFALRLSSVHAYAAAEPFALAQYRWEKRVLVVSAADAYDPNLLRLKNELAAVRSGFAERDMELVILLDTGVSLAGQRSLTRSEVEGARAELGIAGGESALRLIGKDGSVKLSDEGAALTEIFALIDTMPMRRSEMKER